MLIKNQSGVKIRKNLGLSDDKLLIGLVTSGAFAKRNVDLFIRAISKIDEKLKAKCNFVIVGRDPLEAELRKKADELGVDNLEFIGLVDNVEQFFSAMIFQFYQPNGKSSDA